MPVITDTSAQQLQFNNGQLAAILHDLPSSAVEQYLNNDKYSHYSLPTMMASFLYINPNKGIMKDQATRTRGDAMPSTSTSWSSRPSSAAARSARRCIRRTCWPRSTGKQTVTA